MLSTHKSYRQALESLKTIKGQFGATPEVQAIASFLLLAANADLPSGYVGDPSDPRDIAVVEAQREYWQQFIQGDDIEENFYDL